MLAKDFATLSTRFKRLETAFDLYSRSFSLHGESRERGWHSMEGLLSSTWQTWCGFCRSVTLKSCTGTTTRTGLVTNPIVDVTDGGRLAYLARTISKGETIKAGKYLSPHQEPTWGDISLLLDTVRHLGPTNLASLETGLLTIARAPGDIRKVRNAAAHVSHTNLAEVERLKAYYLGIAYAHPVDILTWRSRGTNEYVFNVWLSELRDIADDMTN